MSYNFEEIDLDQLELDKENPRLPKSYRGKDEKDILEYMIGDGSLIELMMAIGKNGYFPGEQLLVVKTKKKNKKKNPIYKVIEGNRRLSAVKLLNKPSLVSEKKNQIKQVLDETTNRPIKIPCLIFPKEKGIHDYLGYRHITGIKEWKLLQKANYLYNTYQANYKSRTIDYAAKELAKMIGSQSPYVKRLLVGYKLYIEIESASFFKIKELNDETFHFNYIADSLNRQNIRNFIGVDLDKSKPLSKLKKENLKKLITWFFKKIYPKPKGYSNRHTKLIADSKSLKDLDTVLGHKKAAHEFIVNDKSLSEALEYTSKLDNTFQYYIDRSLAELNNADDLIHRVKEFDDKFDDTISDVIEVARKIKRLKELKDESEG